MKNLTTKAFILGHKNIGETDKLIILYTKELGKILAKAKGSRRLNSRFTGHLETLSFVTLSLYFGPRNTIITEVISKESHKEIRQNFEKLSAALQIAEITDKILYHNQQIDDLIPLLALTLNKLKHSARPHLISFSYIIKLLDAAGLLPDFKTVNTNLDQKFLKFFHYIQTRPYQDVEKIAINDQENHQVKTFIKKIVEYQIESTLLTLSTPFTASNLSTKWSN